MMAEILGVIILDYYKGGGAGTQLAARAMHDARVAGYSAICVKTEE